MSQHIYVFSPSSAVRDRKAVRRGLAQLKAMGHEVEVDPSAFASSMRFAGDDETRLAAIGRAAASGADLVLTTRGGYGLTRLLPDLPYKALARAVDRGTRFVGLSDFTAMQLAMLARVEAPTWAGPAVGEDFGAEGGPDEVMLACFGDLASGQGEGTGWRLPAAEARSEEFSVRGQLWGGNLCVLSSMVGSAWMPNMKGGILFLEDVGEHPYRIERMLTQLLHAGILARQKAIVMGQFTNYRATPNDKGFRLATVFDWLRAHCKTPVLSGLPFGHVPTKVVLPVGRKVDLLVQGRDAFLLWGHAH